MSLLTMSFTFQCENEDCLKHIPCASIYMDKFLYLLICMDSPQTWSRPLEIYRGKVSPQHLEESWIGLELCKQYEGRHSWLIRHCLMKTHFTPKAFSYIWLYNYVLFIQGQVGGLFSKRILISSNRNCPVNIQNLHTWVQKPFVVKVKLKNRPPIHVSRLSILFLLTYRKPNRQCTSITLS